jgi:hypothetical protein
MNEIETLNALQKISGMLYAAYKYTAEEWQEKTGVNPAHLSPHFFKTHNKRYALSDEARAIIIYDDQRAQMNWYAIQRAP